MVCGLCQQAKALCVAKIASNSGNPRCIKIVAYVYSPMMKDMEFAERFIRTVSALGESERTRWKNEVGRIESNTL